MSGLLPNASEFDDIISGRRRGLGSLLWRTVFSIAEPAYRLGVWRRNRQFDREKRPIHRVGAPVVSVGNLTLGGTGKTPMVEWLAKWYRQRGVQVCIVSRGYGAQQGARNDEALELEEKLPDVPHLQNPDRVAGAKLAIEELDSQLIILDDGFQHRRIYRDLDIVLIDAAAPFGYGRLFPRGALREPLSALERADVVVLTRADAIDARQRETLREIIMDRAAAAVWTEAVHQPAALRSAAGRQTQKTLGLEQLADQPIVAFCGVGNPSAFRRTLEQLGCRIEAFRAFDDHHNYTRDDIAWLNQWAADPPRPIFGVVCTHKDLVKVRLDQLGGSPLWALQIGMEFRVGQAKLERELKLWLDKCTLPSTNKQSSGD